MSKKLVVKINFSSTPRPELDEASPDAEAVRASLAAVRASREASRAKAARDKRRARGIAAALTGMAAVGACGLVLLTRRADGAASQAGDGASAVAAPVADVVPAPAAAAPAIDLAVAPPPAQPAAAAEAEAAACTDAFERRLWRTAAEACAAAFVAQPKDAGLAMKVAHAQHSRNRFADAGAWAGKALALDPTQAEAFVMVARAAEAAGRGEEAAAAYRRYLTLAPRGWHAPTARAALRALGQGPTTGEDAP